MSLESIYSAYRKAGLTHEGACALIANIDAESKVRSNNVQDSYGIPDEKYVFDPKDGIGYGLCQWTLADRKVKLMAFARRAGKPIDDEDMQVQFSIYEMQTDFPGVWDMLTHSSDLLQCTQIVLVKYENPKIKNLGVRYEYAKKYINYFATMPVHSTKKSYYSHLSVEEQAEIRKLPLLYVSCSGIFVGILQVFLGLQTTGYFDEIMELEVRRYQERMGLDTDGQVGKETWASFFTE